MLECVNTCSIILSPVCGSVRPGTILQMHTFFQHPYDCAQRHPLVRVKSPSQWHFLFTKIVPFFSAVFCKWRRQKNSFSVNKFNLWHFFLTKTRLFDFDFCIVSFL